jgi:hypothetical protein
LARRSADTAAITSRRFLAIGPPRNLVVNSPGQMKGPWRRAWGIGPRAALVLGLCVRETELPNYALEKLSAG